MALTDTFVKNVGVRWVRPDAFVRGAKLKTVGDTRPSWRGANLAGETPTRRPRRNGAVGKSQKLAFPINKLAEKAGFEPAEGFTPRTLSRRVT